MGVPGAEQNKQRSDPFGPPLVLAGLVSEFVFLRAAPAAATIDSMPTAATTKKRPASKAATARKAVSLTILPRRTPPPVAFTAGDLLKRTDFGKGLDGAFVESAVTDRAL